MSEEPRMFEQILCKIKESRFLNMQFAYKFITLCNG